MQTTAYFSMEIGLEPGMPTYCGGLGVLAGDMLRSTADLEIPMVALTLLHRKGYFRQRLDAQSDQIEEPFVWEPEKFLELVPVKVQIALNGRTAAIQAWRYWIQGVPESRIPVYLLDTALPENDPYDQTLTDHLYGGDDYYRLCQEAILGLGGISMLRALGHEELKNIAGIFSLSQEREAMMRP